MKTCERIAAGKSVVSASLTFAVQNTMPTALTLRMNCLPVSVDRFFREELHIPDYLLENLGKAKPEEQAEIFEEMQELCAEAEESQA